MLGLAPAAALLFGAIIAPTDPVLASDLQTSRPSKKDLSKIRLGLTSEAGLNDGLAFPFTYLAIYLASRGNDYSQWLGEWFAVEVLYKIAIGSLIGFLSGWLLYKLIFKITSETHHSKVSRGILSLALTLIPYGLTELLGGYGFIAVFIAACAFSNSEDKGKHMDNLHDFTEEVERIFVTFLFVFVGIYVCDNIEMLWDYHIIGTALILLLIIRPLSGWIAFYKTDLSGFEKFVLSFYGIRGVGSIFYLMYAFQQTGFANAYKLIQVTAVTIVLSVIIHGVSATTIQKKLD
jgi:NhaP-type Na+/H+ or K+/H+ antiporter